MENSYGNREQGQEFHKKKKLLAKIKCQDNLRNEELWERTTEVDIRQEIGFRKWKWIGHIIGKPSKNITRQALLWKPHDKRGKERPRETWRKDTCGKGH